jgi:hypothetical protein
MVTSGCDVPSKHEAGSVVFTFKLCSELTNILQNVTNIEAMSTQFQQTTIKC